MPDPNTPIIVSLPEIDFTPGTLRPVLSWRQVVTSHAEMIADYGLSPWNGRLEYVVLGYWSHPRLPPPEYA